MNARFTRTSVLAMLAVSSPLLAQPANNNRANAVAFSTLPAGFSGTTIGANNEGGTAGACGTSGTTADVWYRFDCAADTGVTVSTCSGASWDTVLQAFNVGAGGALGSSIVCNDDECSTQSRINFAAVAGSSYYIRVAGYNGSTGAFTVSMTATVAPPPPAPAPVAHPTQTSPTLPSLTPAPTRTVGPDVTIGDLSDTAYYGGGYVWKADSQGAGFSTEPFYGFATGTNSWNIGDVPVQWTSSNNLHPVIGQAMYRIKNGRFEQVGMSWLKHGFLSTNSLDFANNCDTPPEGGAQLGVNCSDLYGSGLNGSYTYLGPRFDVNPTTGVYTFPWQGLVGSVTANNVARRIAVPYSEISGDVNAGALYITDAVYITQDDSQWGLSANNYSARILRANTLFTSPQFFGSTYRRLTALELWARMDNTVTVTPVDFVESTMMITDRWRHWSQAQPDAQVLPQAQWVTSSKDQNSRFIVASKVINNNNGTWDYEYAVMNLNSHRAGGSFGVRVPGAATNIGFKAPVYHSGERVLNNPWTNNAGNGGKVQWSVDPATAIYIVPGMDNPVQFNPNALMWGTTYNFRFTSSAAPTTGTVRLGLHRPANATGLQATSLGITGVKVPTICLADIGAQGGVAGSDNLLDNNDFVAFIDAFFSGDMLLADLGAQGGVPGSDNVLNNNDFIVFIDAFFAGCGN